MGSYANKMPELNTSYPGHIYNFNPETQTCDVKLAIEELFIGYSNAYSLRPNQVLHDVSVQFVQGNGWSLTFEIPDGTPCWVHFAQRGIDHWLAENKDSAGLVDGLPAPEFGRQFSRNSAVCTVGNQPIPKVIGGFRNSGAEFRNADRSQRISLNEDSSIEIVTGKAKVVITKDSKIEISVESEAVVKAPKITLDGDTTVTKSLTVQGGMSVYGGSGASMQVKGSIDFSGDMKQQGTFTLNGIVVNTHKHTNPEGGDVGPMKA